MKDRKLYIFIQTNFHEIGKNEMREIHHNHDIVKNMSMNLIRDTSVKYIPGG